MSRSTVERVHVTHNLYVFVVARSWNARQCCVCVLRIFWIIQVVQHLPLPPPSPLVPPLLLQQQQRLWLSDQRQVLLGLFQFQHRCQLLYHLVAKHVIKGMFMWHSSAAVLLLWCLTWKHGLILNTHSNRYSHYDLCKFYFIHNGCRYVEFRT